jgi:hypothetical protein
MPYSQRRTPATLCANLVTGGCTPMLPLVLQCHLPVAVSERRVSPWRQLRKCKPRRKKEECKSFVFAAMQTKESGRAGVDGGRVEVRRGGNQTPFIQARSKVVSLVISWRVVSWRIKTQTKTREKKIRYPVRGCEASHVYVPCIVRKVKGKAFCGTNLQLRGLLAGKYAWDVVDHNICPGGGTFDFRKGEESRVEERRGEMVKDQ